MRAGGGKSKGSSAERLVGVQLSLWLTNNKKADLFSRNVLSGGQFTNFHKRGKVGGQPGDLIANDPLAFPFLAKFTVEVKHLADLQWDAFVYDKKRSCFLWKTIIHTRSQATDAGKSWLLVAKQNRKDTLIFMDRRSGLKVLAIAGNHAALAAHVFYGKFYCFRFNAFCALVPPSVFVAKAERERLK